MNINPSKIDNLEKLDQRDLQQVISFYLDERIFGIAALSDIHPVDKAGMRVAIMELIKEIVSMSNNYVFDKGTTKPYGLVFAEMLKNDYEQKRKEKIQG